MPHVPARKSSATRSSQRKAREGYPEPIVAYYRVSTAKQGVSGLGLEAQQEAVRRFAHSRGAVIIAEFEEIETGTSKRHRPVLAKAIQHCRQQGARLVIAKLDRLARSVSFCSKLLEEKLRFVACDMPEANELIIHVLAAIAQHEAKLISERTKAALAAFKARGGRLGVARPDCPLNRPEVRLRGSARSGEQSRQKAILGEAPLYHEIRDLYRETSSYRAVARELNRRGRLTRNNRPWSNVQVRRVLQRWA